MFEPLARANIHQQQVLNLLKQRARLHAQCLYEAQRIESLEQQLFAHIYGLLNTPINDLKPKVACLVKALALLIDEQHSVEYILDCYQQAADDKSSQALAESMCLVAALLPSEYLHKRFVISQDTSFLETLLYRRNHVLELVGFFSISWPVELLQVARRSALAGQFAPHDSASCIMFSVATVSTRELATGYTHSHFALALESLRRGLVSDTRNAQQALFARFAKTTDLSQQLALLALAGASGDIRWVEPCSVFCQAQPEHTFGVLIHFQHKAFLPMLIKLMQTPQCAAFAYQAWITLTGAELQQKPLLQDTSNQHNNAGDACVPNEAHAEHIRQTLMQQPGNSVLGGLSFDGFYATHDKAHSSDSNAPMILKALQGIAVQSALMLGKLASHSDEAVLKRAVQ